MQTNKKNRFLHELSVCSVVVGCILWVYSSIASAQQNPPARPIIASAEIVKLMPEEQSDGKFMAYVRLDVRAGNKPAIIPYCGRTDSGEYFPCAAQLARRNRKIAKPAVWAVMGTLPVEEWKRSTILPGDHAYFLFVFSQSFFGVQKGQKLRVAMDIWENPDSWNEGKSDKRLLSPIFRFPAKVQ